MKYATRMAPFCVVAPTYPMLRDVTLPQFREWSFPFEKANGWHKSDRILELKTGGLIFFRSASDPDKLRGPTYCGFLMDESALCEAEAFDILRGRVLSTGGKGILASTPKGFNWMYEEFVEKQEPEYAFLQSRTVDNTILSEDNILSLRRQYSARFAKQELDGEFTGLEGLVYEEFDRELNLKEYKYDPSKPVECGLDFGYRNPAIIYFQELPEGDIAFAEWTPTDKSVSAMIEELRVYGDNISIIHPDPAGDAVNSQSNMTDIRCLTHAGFPVKYTTRQRLRYIPTGVEIVRSRLCNSVGERRLFIATQEGKVSCPSLLRDIQRYRYPDTKAGRAVSDHPLKDGMTDHTMDALRYWAINKYGPSFGVHSFSESAA